MQNLLGSNHSGGAREMGTKDKRRKSKRRDDSSISPPSSGSGSDDSEPSSRRRHQRDRSRGDESLRRDRERRRRKTEKKERERERKRRKSRSGGKRKRRDDSDSSDGSGSGSGSDGGSETERPRVEPEEAVRGLLAEFPNVGDDLKQLLQMLDDGQAVDIKGVSEKSLCKHLKKLFISLKLKESGDRVFMLHSKNRPTLEVVTPLLHNHAKSKEQQLDHSMLVEEANPVQKDAECGQAIGEDNLPIGPKIDALPPPRRVIGPAMPSAELLAAAAKLTEAQAELRDADLEEDAETFIGPPPPALVAEAESANEAERFEEVTRIMVAEADSPYDVLGVNHKMSTDNVKKRYWKLSLLVHPDKCPHPQANEAFIKLNKSFKDLQDPDKRKALDDKIKLKEEQEAFKVELKAMREAAQWRRIQGISMEGDDELLADMEVKVAPQRDEWMTTLPPEKRPGGMPTHSTSFSKNAKEGRGDTTAWTDTPSERAQRAKTQYLEAYNQATALASNEEERKRQTSDADLVDKYNKAKRSISLVEKHQEEATKSSSKKKSKQKQKREKEEWKGQHPWKPWDREKDLTAGRQNVKLESGDMVAGLTSRFSSANFQRNFL